MPQMAEIVDRHAAHVHAHLARIQGLKALFLVGQVIVDFQHWDRPLDDLLMRKDVIGIPLSPQSEQRQRRRLIGHGMEGFV
jgi:hypothetical protein